ncbi:MAG: hypothetical protein VXV96_02355 [Bdellovibrionota bacterium]|jgi:hypothetical protein|nr:hypothetical protein [Bdellovibrionota bacterium]
MDIIKEKFSDLETYSPKKLRTLRNNLNNRISHFESSGDKAKDLKPSQRLYGLDEDQCKSLLSKVQELLKNL